MNWSSKMKLWAPLIVLVFALLGAGTMVLLRPRLAAQDPPAIVPLVSVMEVHPQEYRYLVHAYGTVQPRIQSDLVPQVSGEVVWVSPELVPGGFFKKGEVLLEVDQSDAFVDLQSARASEARAKSEFNRAKIERTRQQKLKDQGVASQARIDDALNVYQIADAQLKEAEARLVRAERDLVRTKLRAPFPGRVRSESVDLGQFISRGNTVATLYGVEWVEVPLPIPDRELKYVDIPLGSTFSDFGEKINGEIRIGPMVKLSAELAGVSRVWTGHVVRTEGEIDLKTRMVNVVVRVKDPYGLLEDTDHSPLPVGLFVEAEIVGRSVEGVYLLPRSSVIYKDVNEGAGKNVVHVIDKDGRLVIRDVELLRSQRSTVVVGKGLNSGERIAMYPLQDAVNGMSVRTVVDHPILEQGN